MSAGGPGFQPAPRTLFNTPLVTPVMRAIARTVFRLLGWRFEGEIPSGLRQAVVIGAPHTSNWDLPYMLMAAFVLERQLHWLGKAQIFRFPFGALMRWMGGIPVDRSRANNLVEAAVQCFAAERAPLLLVVPPEGTRQAVTQWKTGFYYIALGAEVPVVMAYMDHATRTCGVGQLFYPTGNIETDMIDIRAYYAPFRGWARRHEERS